MKRKIVFSIYLALFIGMLNFTSCSKDDMPEDPNKPNTPNQPENPTPDEPTNPVLDFVGSWSIPSSNFGITSNVVSTSVFEFSESGNLKVTWSEAGNETPYTSGSGNFTVKDGTLKIQWNDMATDGTKNQSFNSFYLSGEYTVSLNTIEYSYSVYSSDNKEMSGKNTIKFTKMN